MMQYYRNLKVREVAMPECRTGRADKNNLLRAEWNGGEVVLWHHHINLACMYSSSMRGVIERSISFVIDTNSRHIEEGHIPTRIIIADIGRSRISPPTTQSVSTEIRKADFPNWGLTCVTARGDACKW